MYINPYAWNKKANILFLESPAGVGFSQGTEKYLVQNDTSVAKDNLKAVQIFFDRYSRLQGNDFYIAGESYAGCDSADYRLYLLVLEVQGGLWDVNQEELAALACQIAERFGYGLGVGRTDSGHSEGSWPYGAL
ncbi:unnamed protein product [Sphagnum balticum]